MKCDFKKLGPKFGKQMKAVAAAVAGMSQEAIAELEKNGKYVLNLDGAEAVIEAARIDGAGEFRILLTIVLPMSIPMVATMTLLIGLSYWNDWKNGLYYLQQNKSLYSIQVLLNDMLRDVQALKSGMDAAAAAEITANMPSTGIKMAIAVVGVLPVLVVYPFFQKYFVKGITIGAVKG